MSVVIVNGISGQDGSYLAELMLADGFQVVGLVRDLAGASAKLPESLRGKVDLFLWDMRDEGRLRALLREARPTGFYNLAACARGNAMFDDPVGIGEINALAVARILEAIREVDANVRFCQASSSEMFGDAVANPQTENSTMRPVSPYGAAKLFAHNMVQIYRRRHGVFACSAILFNHESPRRGLAFVTRKVTHTAAKIKLGQAAELRLGNLDARRDWGFAPDYARAMRLMMEMEQADDYVVATGESHSVREFCAFAFGRLGMDYRDYVIEDPALFRPIETVEMVGDASKARSAFNWQPSTSFREVVELMVDSDLRLMTETTLP